MNTTQRLTEQTDDEVVEIIEKTVDESEVVDKAINIMEVSIEDGKHYARGANSIAAGVVYIAYCFADYDVTETEIADRYNVTPLTLHRAEQATLDTLGLK